MQKWLLSLVNLIFLNRCAASMIPESSFPKQFTIDSIVYKGAEIKDVTKKVFTYEKGYITKIEDSQMLTNRAVSRQFVRIGSTTYKYRNGLQFSIEISENAPAGCSKTREYTPGAVQAEEWCEGKPIRQSATASDGSASWACEKIDEKYICKTTKFGILISKSEEYQIQDIKYEDSYEYTADQINLVRLKMVPSQEAPLSYIVYQQKSVNSNGTLGPESLDGYLKWEIRNTAQDLRFTRRGASGILLEEGVQTSTF